MKAAPAGQPNTEAQLQMAEAMLEQRRLDAAQRYFREAEACGASADRCAAGRWMIAMLKGDFAAAWQESDAIRARGMPDPHRMWAGENLTDMRVIVRCLHGFGDTVQFARYAGLLNRKSATVVWEVPPAMLQIMRCFSNIHHVMTWDNEYEAGRDYDVQVELMELPYLFRTTSAELPISEKYVRLPHAIVQRAAAEMGVRTKPRVGVVWSAGSWNESRSIPYSTFRGTLEVDDCEFWNLQGGPSRNVDAVLRDAPVCSSGILCLAGAISQMDLVLTTDTLAAHLAGALGVPIWLMLQHAADWRWMVGRDHSPWYPSMRIFRQPRPGAWDEVVGAVTAKLGCWAERMERREA